MILFVYTFCLNVCLSFFFLWRFHYYYIAILHYREVFVKEKEVPLCAQHIYRHASHLYPVANKIVAILQPPVYVCSCSLQASTELEAKRSLLKSDEGLYRLYKEMVVSGLITAEEFWANRQVQVLYRGIIYHYLYVTIEWA